MGLGFLALGRTGKRWCKCGAAHICTGHPCMASSVYELFTCVSARYTDTSKKTLYHDSIRSEQRRYFHVLRHTGSKGEPSVTGMQ